MDQDRSYYRRRIDQERSAADSANCGRARAVHLEMLELYSARLRLLESVSAFEPYAIPGVSTPAAAGVASSMAASSSLKPAI
jgi:hypothetical protein